MVKKLFKHEFSAYLRLCVPVYIILLSIGLMGRIIQCFESESTSYFIMRGSSIAALSISAVVALVLTEIFCIVRFYKNLFTGEGYLSFTLPVTPAQHVLVKFVVALCVNIATLVMVGLSVVVFTMGEWLSELWKAGIYLLKQLALRIEIGHFIAYTFEFAVLFVFMLGMSILLYYMCISLGQTAKKNRVLAAVGVYFLLYILTQIVSTFGTIFVSVFHEELGLDRLLELAAMHPYTAVHVVLIGLIILSVVFSGIYFAVTHYVLHKKLNLE